MVALALALLLAAPQGPDTAVVLDTVAHGARPEVERAIDRIQFLGAPRALLAELARMAVGERAGSRENALYVLSVLHPPEAGPVFLELLGDDAAPMRMAACQGLAHLRPAGGDAGAAVGARLGDAVSAVRRDCARTLTAWNGAGQGPALARALAREKDPDARLAEIEALGHAPGKGSVAALEPALASKDETERHLAARSLAQLGAMSGRKALEGELASPQASERLNAVKLLAEVPAPWSSDALAQHLADASAQVSLRAGQALAARRDPRGIRGLVLAAEHAAPEDRPDFELALHALGVTQAQRLDILAGAERR